MAIRRTVTLTVGTDVADDVSASRGSLTSTFKFTAGNEAVTAGVGTLGAADILLDASTADADVLTATLGAASGAFMGQNIETMTITAAAAAAELQLDNVSGVRTINVSGATASKVSGFAAATLQPTINSNTYTNSLTVTPATLAGTTALGTAETINVGVTGASYGTTAATQTAIIVDGAGGAGTLETLNITSSGTAANTFALSTAGAGALGTVNLLGGTDATVRMTHADVTGVTVVGSANTANTTLLIDRQAATTTATNLTGVSGVDTIAFRDSTAGTDSLVATE